MRRLINEFDGTTNAFLSNFYPSKIVYNGMTYYTAEAAFQGQKPKFISDRFDFQKIKDPSEAKAMGRRCELRNDWEEIKDQVMYDVVYAKFSQNKQLLSKLLKTGSAELVEGTRWCDKYWGIDLYTGSGYNHLGLILEKVREDLGGWIRDYEEDFWLKKLKNHNKIVDNQNL